jgi:surface antigen
LGLRTAASGNSVKNFKNIASHSIASARTGAKDAKRSVIKKARTNIHALAPLSMAIMLVGIVIMGSTTPNTSQPLAARTGGLGGVSALDEVSAAEIAARIAVGADLIVSDNVQNLADSQKAQVEFATTEGAYLAKPQLVATEAKTKDDITTYTVKDGDSIDSIARKFNITSDTIRWENDITGDAISPGEKITILPVSGVRYRVRSGDTAKSLADRYSANAAQIVAFNDAEIDGLPLNDYIIIPNGEQPAPAAPTYFSSGYGYSFGSQPLYGGNGYSYGYCTWHAANRRAAIGRPIPRNLGNAVTWATLAAQAGFGVGEMPQAGAVLWHKNTYIAGGLGHVGFVEQMLDDGSILVSDMNYGGWNVVTTRVIAPSEFNQYLFIY